MRADVGVTVLVAVLTLLVALVAGLVPRAVGELSASDLRYAAGALSDPLRDYRGVLSSFPIGPDPAADSSSDPIASVYGRLDAALAAARAKQKQPLRGILQDPLYVVEMSDATAAGAPEGVDPPGTLRLRAAADPGYLSRVRITAGDAPRPWRLPPGVASGAGIGGTPAAPIEMTISEDTARSMRISVGDLLPTAALGTVRVSGLFAAKDADADYWQGTPSVLEADLFDDGNKPPVYTGTGYLAPATLAALSQGGVDLTTTVWYPIAADAVTPGNARALAAGIRGANQSQLAVPSDIPGVTALISMQSRLAEAVDGSLARVAATVALLSICVSGPLGVVLAVFALGVRAVIERRSGVLALAGARGASGWQLRSAAAVEGLLVGLPAAVVGAVVAALVLPAADAGAGAWVAPLLVGLVPAALFAALGGRRAFRTARRDLSARARGGIRLALSIAIIAVAVLAAFLLLRRGRLEAAGIDPLLALTPLLLALAASVLVLWALPPVLHAVGSLARRGRGIVGFVGSARALRDPALGVAAALAVVVGISVAVFSSVVLTTVDGGARAHAESVVGADIRASGAIVTPAQQKRIAAAPGVARVAPVARAGQLGLGLNGVTDDATVLLTDSALLHAQRPAVPANLGAKVDGRIPVLISRDLSAGRRVGADLRLGAVDVRVVGILPDDAGLPVTATWVLIDRAFTTDVGQASFTPDTLLVELAPGADAARAVAAVRAAVPDAIVDDVEAEVAATRAAPTATGLRVTLVGAAAGGALLAALAVFAGSVTASASRNRSIGMLRTMGMSARQSLGLVAWEIVPIVAVGVVVGGALGLAMPALVVATTDLAPFTGGTTMLPLRPDAVQLTAVVASFLILTGAATIVAVLAARRASPATTVKMGAE